MRHPALSFLLVLLALLAWEHGLKAEGGPGIQRCHSFSETRASLEDVLSGETQWACGDAAWEKRQPVTWLRFQPAGDTFGASGSALVMRLMQFDSVTVFARNGGATTEMRFALDDFEANGRGPFLSVALPEEVAGAELVLVRIDGAELRGTGSQALLAERGDLHGWGFGTILMLAAIFGLVCAPLVLNILLFGALRQRFMLFYAGMTLGMLISLAFATGLLVHFVPASPRLLVGGLELGFVIIVSSAGFFAAEFIERECLPEMARKALWAAATICLVVSGGFALSLPPFEMLDHRGFALGFIPMLLATIAAMIIAFVRGSRWVRYIMISWVPAIGSGIDLAAQALGFQVSTRMSDVAPFLAMGFEVLVTGVAVSHRLMLLRKDRDQARHEARTMQNLSTRDPLTGLMNRRAIENRFAALRGQRFDTVALLDLDNFKQINDRYGHVIGDDVLRATAKALAVVMEDRNGIAVRMGGEEFMLLLRGKAPIDRAEGIRQSITRTIAEQLPDLKESVTASMGAIQIPARHMSSMEFGDLYERADSLLYEAKRAGRDRLISEKLTLFPGQKPQPA